MSQIKTLNGVQYTLPQYNDTAWGANTGNVLTQYLAAIADVTLQLSGGSFMLTAETDFGANFGLKALYLKSETTAPASAGVVRLAKTDSIGWRNNANGADKLLSIDASDNLQYAATKVLLSGAVVNADINASAAIVYSKLNLAASIVNADIATGAAIAYAKLTLTGSIVNADIGASAAIALSKLAALGVGKALQSNAATGAIEVSAVTNTELGYVSGVTSAIQTQLNATVANPLTSNLAAGSHKITGGAAATAATDFPIFSQVGVLQTVSATTVTVFTTTSATFAATSLAATITPKFSTSKIRIEVTGIAQGGSGGAAQYTITRGGTNLGSSAGFGRVASGTENPVAMVFVDSPAVTTALTYDVRILQNTSGTAQWGETNCTQSIILTEIQ